MSYLKRQAAHGSAGATLGLLDPANGAVREVGRLACGTIYDAVWR
jgi:hypothetical protein